MNNYFINHQNLKNRNAITLFILCGAAILFGAFWTLTYPYGRRCCSFRSVHLALLTYSEDHQGWFPEASSGPLAALQSLYPVYCPDGSELAGISGDVESVVKTLRAGKPLDEDLTSWRYVPGLRNDDDPNLALLWANRPGLNANGSRNILRRRPVLLISGDITNVLENDWAAFKKEQQALLATTKKKHIQ
jgi:hypothetical protein